MYSYFLSVFCAHIGSAVLNEFKVRLRSHLCNPTAVISLVNRAPKSRPCLCTADEAPVAPTRRLIAEAHGQEVGADVLRSHGAQDLETPADEEKKWLELYIFGQRRKSPFRPTEANNVSVECREALKCDRDRSAASSPSDQATNPPVFTVCTTWA